VNEPRFQIDSSKHHCVACAAEVPEGDRYFSAVLFADDAFQRRDYCLPCWPTTRPADAFAFWQTRRLKTPQDAQRRLRFDSGLVLEFFRKLCERLGTSQGSGAASDAAPTISAEADAEVGSAVPEAAAPAETSSAAAPARLGSRHEDLAFVLALLLLRKKVLIFESSGQRDGEEWIHFCDRDTPPRRYWVRNPELGDAELDRIRDDLGGLLEMKL
jgi:hypothetical protein